MIINIILILIVAAIAFLFYFGRVTGRRAVIDQLLSRQYSNMVLFWDDHKFHPDRPMCKKHAEFIGSLQPVGKCSECGVSIRYDESIKFTFPTPPTTLKRLKKYWEKIFVRPQMDKKFYSTPAASEVLYNPDSKRLFLINVVFYDADTVELHYEACKKFIKDPFEYFVLDNTDETGRSERVRKYCESQKINYVRLQRHDAWARWKDGTSHAFGLDWGYHNIIERFKPEVFGLIDGDMFPTEPVSILEMMGTSDAWGAIVARLPFWHFWSPIYYVWPGFSFFRTERFKKKAPNFLPTWGLDNGGKQPVDGPKLLLLPGTCDYDSAPWTEVMPGVYTRMYGTFTHFTAASWQPTGLKGQTAWMRDLINNS